MARDHVRLDSMIVEDEFQAWLLETNPLAAAIFLWSLPAADAFGILPGTARKFAARVCPMANIDPDTMQGAIDALCSVHGDARGPYYRYTDANGDELIYIRNYHKYQEVGWGRVGKPKHGLPDCWVVPPELEELIRADLTPDSRSFRARAQILASLNGRVSTDMSVTDVAPRREGKGIETTSHTVAAPDAPPDRGRDSERQEPNDGADSVLALQPPPDEKPKRRRFTGHLAAIVDHAAECGWPDKDTGQFMNDLVSVLKARDTQDRLCCGNVDDAAEVVLRVLRTESINTALLKGPPGRAKLLARIVEIAAKVGSQMANEE